MRWTKEEVIRQIKRAKRAGEPLNRAAVIERGDDLTRALWAATRRGLFGSWPRALTAAGVDASSEACYERWDKQSICWELRQLQADGVAMTRRAVAEESQALASAAVRHFGSWSAAVRAMTRRR